MRRPESMAPNETLSLVRRSRDPPLLFLVVVVVVLFWSLLLGSSEGGKRRISIPDELDDVVDDEEDEEWKHWGRRKTAKTDLPPLPDFSRMSPQEIQDEMMKRHTGPSIGFVKLRPGVPRSKDDVTLVAMQWSQILRTGSMEARFMAVDLSTIMFTMQRGQDLEELKEFVLSQPEAYEIKIGEHLYRRPGDPPLDEVVESLRVKASSNSQGTDGDLQDLNDEL